MARPRIGFVSMINFFCDTSHLRPVAEVSDFISQEVTGDILPAVIPNLLLIKKARDYNVIRQFTII